MVDLTPFKEQIDSAINNTRIVSTDPRGEFLSVLLASGYKVKGVVEGRIERCDGPDDKSGRKSGWYVYREINDSSNPDYVIGVGSYGSWKTGEEHSWSSRSDATMTKKERMDFFAAKERMRQEQEAEKLERQKETAIKASEWYARAGDVSEHDYLARKGVDAAPHIKQDGDILLIPRANEKGEIVNIERIYPDGTKKGMFGGQTKGTWFKIDGDNSTVYVAEGYSTAMSIHMATGNTVFISFTAGNLYEVVGIAKGKYDNIVIAADNDYKNDKNVGLEKAEQAADAYGVRYIFPEGVVDFNDMHVEHGLDALRSFFAPKKPEKNIEEPTQKKKSQYINPRGVMADMVAYYNATSGNHQPDFAIQTALALCSIVLARSYKTNYENYSSLFLLNVAKSGTGKEHVKTVVEKVLLEAGYPSLIAGDGYTSAGGVFSELLNNPKHISIIDEFGRYLEAGRDMGKGTSHQREANTKLMESIGRAHSVLRPPSYSTMTLKKEQAEELRNRHIHNPAITLMAMTTPDTLFNVLDIGAIKDGFVNRFIISLSDAQRAVRKHKPPVDVPESIIRWIKAVIDRHGEPHLASEKAKPIELVFTDRANEMQIEFQEYCIDEANKLEKVGMAELTGRCNEMAMRLALIHALSRDSQATIVDHDDMAFGIEYIRYCYLRTVTKLKMTISSSEFEGTKKEVLAALREKGDNGITKGDMVKVAPFSKYRVKDLNEILMSLKDADLAYDEVAVDEEKGKPEVIWRALE